MYMPIPLQLQLESKMGGATDVSTDGLNNHTNTNILHESEHRLRQYTVLIKDHFHVKYFFLFSV